MNFRFRLRDLFFLTLYAACLCAWVQGTWSLSNWTLAEYVGPGIPVRRSGVFLLFQRYVPSFWGIVGILTILYAGVRSAPQRGRAHWGWLVLGGMIVLASHTDGIYDCFNVMGHGFPEEYRHNIVHNLIHTLTIPTFVGIAAAYRMSPAIRHTTRGERLLIGGLLVAVVNVVLLNAALVTLYTWDIQAREQNYRRSQQNTTTTRPSRNFGVVFSQPDSSGFSPQRSQARHSCRVCESRRVAFSAPFDGASRYPWL